MYASIFRVHEDVAEVPVEHWYLSTKLHSTTFQKSVININIFITS
jgi:hypothetical protein